MNRCLLPPRLALQLCMTEVRLSEKVEPKHSIGWFQALWSLILSSLALRLHGWCLKHHRSIPRFCFGCWRSGWERSHGCCWCQVGPRFGLSLHLWLLWAHGFAAAGSILVVRSLAATHCHYLSLSFPCALNGLKYEGRHSFTPRSGLSDATTDFHQLFSRCLTLQALR